MKEFRNTPRMVENIIRKLPLRQRLPDLRYFAGAGHLIGYYLNRDIFRSLDDPFLRLENRMADGRNWEFPARIIQMAELLFALRDEPGFGEICRRMASRDLDSAYGELASAAMIIRHGFSVEARPEIGKITEDFDFSITQPGFRANVEIWTLRQPRFLASGVLRRLKDKKKQLPADAPAIIVCVFPEAWFDQVERLYDHFDTLSDRFFGGSRRINHLMFAHEEFESSPPGGHLSLHAYTVPNPAPRHPSTILDAFAIAPDVHDAIDAFLQMPKGPMTIQEQHEFHRWINWLVGA